MAELQDILKSGNITLVDSNNVIVGDNIQYLQANSEGAEDMFLRIGKNGLTSLYRVPNQDVKWRDSDNVNRALSTTEQEVLTITPNLDVTADDGSYTVVAQFDNTTNQEVNVLCLFYVDDVLVKTNTVALAKSQTGKTVIFSSALSNTISADSECNVRFSASSAGVNLRGDLLNTSIDLVKAEANPVVLTNSVGVDDVQKIKFDGSNSVDVFPIFIFDSSNPTNPSLGNITIQGVTYRTELWDEGDEQTVKFELNHEYKSGEGVELHCRVFPTNDLAGIVEFSYEYFVLHVDGTTDSGSTESGSATFAVSDKTNNIGKYISIPLTGTNLVSGDMVIGIFSRSNNSYNDEVSISEIGLHIPVGKTGDDLAHL